MSRDVYQTDNLNVIHMKLTVGRMYDFLNFTAYGVHLQPVQQKQS